MTDHLQASARPVVLLQLLEELASLRPLTTAEGFGYATGADLVDGDVDHLRAAMVLADLLQALGDLLERAGYRPPKQGLLGARGAQAEEEMERRGALRHGWPPLAPRHERLPTRWEARV